MRITSTPEGISWISEFRPSFNTEDELTLRQLGKGKWPPIENGFIEWDASTGNNDPAGDLSNVTLTLPTPPPSAFHQQHQQPRIPSHHSSSSRAIRPFPRRAPSHAYSNRVMSVNMSAPSPVYQQQQPQTAAGSSSYYNPSTAIPQSAPPMYGEDDVPMSVQLHQPQHHHHHQHQHNGMSTPLQMINTPMPQVPGGNWYQSHTQGHSQSQSQSQVQTPMPTSITPVPMEHGMLNVDQSGSSIPNTNFTPAGDSSGLDSSSPEEEDESDNDDEEGEEELKERSEADDDSAEE